VNKWAHAQTIFRDSISAKPESGEKKADSERKEWVWDYLGAAAQSNEALADYDPRFLREYLLWGNFAKVHQILDHLAAVLRSLKDSDLKDLRVLPPMSITKLLKEDTAPATTGVTTAQYTDLFAAPTVDDIDDIADGATPQAGSQTSIAFLREKLTSLSLPGVTNRNQVMLLAVLDTLSQLEAQKRALDENGVRYLLALRLFFFLTHSLPLAQRPKGLEYNEIIWALHSESQDILVDNCVTAAGAQGSFNWTHMRAVGMGFWIRNTETLKRVVETVAKNIFMSHEDKDPIGCALFYLALNKKSVWFGLWKIAKMHPEYGKMTGFLANNFSEPRWKQAALKNAFQLLGLQRFEYAASFFLLAGSLKDAVNVCIKNLKDFQLAVVICRLYEGDGSPLLADLLGKTVLPDAILQGNRWLAGIAYWHLGQREKALRVIVEPLSNFVETKEQAPSEIETDDLQVVDTSLLVFFQWFKRLPTFKPLVSSLQFVPPSQFVVVFFFVLICPFFLFCRNYEALMFLKISKVYERAGHFCLSLHVLHLWKDLMAVQLEENAKALIASRAAPLPNPKKDTAAGLFDDDYSSGSTSSLGFGFSLSGGGGNGGQANDLDWGTPSAGLDDFGLSDDPEPAFKLDLFQAPPKPALPPPTGPETAPEGEKKQDAADVAVVDPLLAAKKEVLPQFLQREGLLREQQNLVSMKFLTTVMRGKTSLESASLSKVLASGTEFDYNLDGWLISLASATDVKPAALYDRILDFCNHYEKFQSYADFLMKSSIKDPATLLFEKLLSKSRTLVTLYFTHKLDSLKVTQSEVADVHYYSSLWAYSNELCSVSLRMKAEIQEVVEQNPFFQQWKLLEVVWSIAVTNALCALEEKRYQALADFMRQIATHLMAFGRSRREILPVLQKILADSEKLIQPNDEELEFVTMDDDGMSRQQSDDEDAGGIEIHIKESPESAAFRKKYAPQLLQLSLTRLLISLMDAHVNIIDQKTQEGTSFSISIGIFAALIKLSNSLERSLKHHSTQAETLNIGKSILAVFKTTDEKNLWAALQEIHNDTVASLSSFSSLIGLMVSPRLVGYRCWGRN